jgi:hypothetical protein
MVGLRVGRGAGKEAVPSVPLCPQFELITASALQFHRLDALWIG